MRRPPAGPASCSTCRPPGGGGRGMRIVEKPETIERNFKSASDEALAAFGNGDMFIEKYLQNPKLL